MEGLPSTPPASPDPASWTPSAPVWAVPAARPRLWVHVVLLGATALTLAFTGSFWEGTYDRVSPLGALREALVHPITLVAGVPFALCVLAILGSHEMGHYLACRRYRIPASLPFFIPGIPPFGTFGAVIRIRGVIPDRKALFDVAAAGPIAGFVVAIPILILGILLSKPVTSPSAGEGTVYLGSPLLLALVGRWAFGDLDLLRVGSVFVAGWFGMLVTSMNLFPVGQLDGGHAIYALSRPAHRVLARATILALIGMIALQLLAYREVPAYTAWCAVLLWMRDRHPRLADEATPLDLPRRLAVLLLLLIFTVSFIPLPISM